LLIASPRAARTNRLFAIFCGVSFVLHVAVVVVWVVSSFQKAPAVKLEDNVVKTRLVKLGKQRDEKLLPRLDAAPPPPPPVNQKGPPTPEVPKDKAPDKKPEPKEEQKRSTADILKDFAQDKPKSIDDLIKDRIGERLDEGHEDGSELGTDITGRLKADYNDLLQAKVKQAYVLPTTLTDEERVRLWTNLFVKVGPEGQLLDVRLSPSSGNTAFDSAVLAAARKAAPFPPPPLQLRDFYQAGVGMKVCPLTCN
jgi:colicin import membrane protein